MTFNCVYENDSGASINYENDSGTPISDLDCVYEYDSGSIDTLNLNHAHDNNSGTLINNLNCDFVNNCDTLVNVAADTVSEDINGSRVDPWKDLKEYRAKYPRQFIIGALNINSIRNKFSCINPVLNNGFIDCFSVIESKVDESFTDPQFYVDGFNLYRQDSTCTSGGIMSWIRSDVANRRRNDVEVNNECIQSLCIEINIVKEKWFILSVYRLPSANLPSFIVNLSKILDKLLLESKMINIIGDINVNMLATDSKSISMHDFLGSYSLKNLITDPTCFKGVTSSLIDVILVTNNRRYEKCLNYTCGLSDYHNLIACCTKIHVPRSKPKVVYYRSYKNFNETSFKEDISRIPFHIIDVFENTDDKYWAFNCMTEEIINSHAPLKKKFLRKDNCPHMNSNLKKIMYKKRMAQNAFWKDKGNQQKWEKYRSLRNEFVKVNKASRRNYFKEHCKEGVNSRNFWQTIKPYMTNNCKVNNDIMLKEGDNIVTDSSKIAKIFADYFVSSTDGFGFIDDTNGLSVNEIYLKYMEHDSIKSILSSRVKENTFRLSNVTEAEISKLLAKVNPKKSIGYDNFPPKLLKVAKDEFAPFITSLINIAIDKSHFPSDLKYAEIAPVFKKENRLDKTKYRPVSILPCVSKIFEKVINTKLGSHFYDTIAGQLSAYRNCYSTQSVLLKAVEDWRLSLDQGKFVGAVLMDLSKAFDVIPHGLLVAKLKAYGYDEGCTKLILHYLSHRYQRVKINNARSSWHSLTKGVPQGSILGPTLFNIFMNDIFYAMKDYSLYNYADDNTVCYSSNSIEDLTTNLEKCGNEMTDWFSNNGMRANPDKYQVMIFKKGETPQSITIKGNVIHCQSSVKLLGITIDDTLSFNKQVEYICRKAGRQVNAMMRLCNALDTEVKEIIYKSFIHSNFNYCPAVWLICSESNLDKLSKLQYRALKFVYNDFMSDYESLLLKGNHSSVSVHLMHSIAIEVYKCIKGTSPEYLSDIFERHVHSHGTRNHSKLLQKRFNTVRYGYCSFKYLGAKIWNNLPMNVKESINIGDFKKNLRMWKNCTCLSRGLK